MCIYLLSTDRSTEVEPCELVMTRGSANDRLTVALQVAPVYLVLSIGMLRVLVKVGTLPVAVEVLVTGPLSVEISHTISTTTFKSTALLTVAMQVREEGVPAVKEVGVVNETPGVGTRGRK